MKQINYLVSSLQELEALMSKPDIQSWSAFRSQFVQIFSAKNEQEWYLNIGETIRRHIPNAIIVGASSVGEINEGRIKTNSTIVLFSYFEQADLHLFSCACKAGDEAAIGEDLARKVKALNVPVKGLLLLSTPISNDSGTMFNIITSYQPTYPIFGGGAGDYANARKTLIYDGTNCFEQGLVSVAFSGETLSIDLHTYLEWHPLSKIMTITGVDGMHVTTIDDKPAFAVYEKLLGIKADDKFFQNSLEFPFLIERNGRTIARTPFFADEKTGAIQLVADVKVGDKFRIGYGNPQMILAESVQIHEKMRHFQPEAIFLYTCICRRFLMQEDVDQETLPFASIAPTAGFYTFGEFCSNAEFSSLLNSTLVAVGFRESTPAQLERPSNTAGSSTLDPDPYANQHTRILSRLLYFIHETTKELEAQNEKLVLLNEQKNEILGIAAHDLRNPIGVIQGFAEIAEEKTEGEPQNYLRIILSETDKLLRLLNDLLDISKIESGVYTLNKKNTNFKTVVEQCIQNFSHPAQVKNIRIETDLEAGNCQISLDRDKMEQAINNLISNALKFSPPGSTVQIRLSTDSRSIRTEVVDQGLGIKEKEIKDIFLPFKRSSTQPTAGESSHGLGLAIVKKIIEAHHGSIGVQSEYGAGSTFYFTLQLNDKAE